MNPHADIRDAITRVIKYADRGPWLELREARTQEALGGLFARFNIDGEQLQEQLEILGVLGAFLSLGVEDAVCAETADGTASLIEEYLQRRGFQETPRARRYLQALRTSPVELFEIIAVEPGAWVELRNVLREGSVQRVSAPVWSHEMVPHHRVAGRVLAVDDGLTFSNAVLQLDQEQGERLQRILEQAGGATADQRVLAEESGIDAQVLARIDDGKSNAVGTAVLQFWLHTLLDGTLGEPAGIDGEPDDYGDYAGDDASFELYTGSMPFDPADAAVITERLDALPGWKRALPDEERWIRRTESDKDPASLELDVSLADISLNGDELVIETESEEVVEQIVAEIKAALGELVGEAFIMCEEIEEPADAEAALRAIQRETYRCLLDEPQPGFGNCTPREYAASAEGRHAVAAWLRSLEELEKRQAGAIGVEPYDITWMWRELALEGERR